MASSLYRETLAGQTRAALDALLTGHSDESPWEAEVLTLVLERWGDALRLGEARDLKIEQQLHGVTPALLGRVARDRIDEAQEWVLPAPDNVGPDIVDDISFAVTRRDETESLLDAVSRWMRISGGLAIDVPGVHEVLSTLEAFDMALAQVAPREVVEQALGVRVALHDDGTWLARIPDADTQPPREVDAEPDEPGRHLHSAPSESATDAYVRLGKLAAYVERAAQHDALFAEDLALTIDALLACDESIAWRARSWRKRYKSVPAPAQLHRIALAGAQVLAAASEEEPASAERGYQSLGALPGVAAEVDLTIEGEQLVVRAYPAALTELRVNDVPGAPVPEDACWAVRLPFQRKMELRLLIVDDGGARFEDAFTVA